MNEVKQRMKYFYALEKRSRYKLIKRYDKPLSYHDVKIINDILYNEKTHYVEQFKEYLIYEDYNEFLKRYYSSTDLKQKLQKILFFYEKYSKIYANYTVIPESKYMYKNIKRKQKMIDQMQNNGNNDSEYEEDEESNEDMSNTIFSSKIMNSIYRNTLASMNKSENCNTEQSINDFVGKINNVENKIKSGCLKNNYFKNIKKYNKSQKEIILPMKKIQKNFFSNKNTPRSTKANLISKKLGPNFTTRMHNNNQKHKIINIQFTYSNKNLQNDINKINDNANSKNNNTINKNSGSSNNSNLIFINSYINKNNNNNNNKLSKNILNNKSLGNTNYSNSNNSNKLYPHKNSLNSNYPKKQPPSALLKQRIIKKSNNINDYKQNLSTTNINNYFNKPTNNLKTDRNYKLSLGETLLKGERIVLSTNSSNSPNNALIEKVHVSPNKKHNIYNNNKKQLLLKDRQNYKDYINQPFNSNKLINTKKLHSHLLGDYNQIGNNLTILHNKFMEKQNLSNINKMNKKKISKKIIDIRNNNNQRNSKTNEFSETKTKIIFKNPETQRNYHHSKMLSENHSSTNNTQTNSNKNFKITVGLKHDLKYNSQKIISSPSSLSNSSSNFYIKPKVQNYNEVKNNKINYNNELMETNNKNLVEGYNKKRVIHNYNYNIVNNINDNSTQINIYTGNELYKSLHFPNNSSFNSSNLTPANTYCKSPKMAEGDEGTKNKKNFYE